MRSNATLVKDRKIKSEETNKNTFITFIKLHGSSALDLIPINTDNIPEKQLICDKLKSLDTKHVLQIFK